MSKEQQEQPSFSEIRQRLQAGEDFDLANRLQEREYEMYYSHNRNVNGTIVSDRRKTREEQSAEDEHANALRRMGLAERSMTDEEYARQLQEEMDHQDALERMDKDAQLREDERIARILQQEPGLASTSTVPHDLISFEEQVPTEQYNNMANQLLEQPPALHLSPTNPFLADVEEYYRTERS